MQFFVPLRFTISERYQNEYRDGDFGHDYGDDRVRSVSQRVFYSKNKRRFAVIPMVFIINEHGKLEEVEVDYVECDVCNRKVGHGEMETGFCHDCGCCLEHCQCFGDQNTSREPSADHLSWES